MNERSDLPPPSPEIVLTIAIPTFNRANYLTELVESLAPQLLKLPYSAVELLISDNCSQDGTPEAVLAFQSRGLRCRYIRNQVNVGSDRNFLQCLEMAKGKYVWVLGDDEVIVPDAIRKLLDLLEQDEFDLVYLSTFGFLGPYEEGTTRDRLGRCAEIMTDGAYFLGRVNALIGLISANIVNKQRLMAVSHDPLESLVDTNLIQVGWLFPLIRPKMKVLYVWERFVGYRMFNSGGWSACEVFGIRLNRLASRYFKAFPTLHRSLMNQVLRLWMFDSIIQIRVGLQPEMNFDTFAKELRRDFGQNWRYWLFIYPVAELPLPAAKLFHKILAAINRCGRMAAGLAHHWFCRGRYLYPSIVHGKSGSDETASMC